MYLTKSIHYYILYVNMKAVGKWYESQQKQQPQRKKVLCGWKYKYNTRKCERRIQSQFSIQRERETITRGFAFVWYRFDFCIFLFESRARTRVSISQYYELYKQKKKLTGSIVILLNPVKKKRCYYF